MNFEKLLDEFLVFADETKKKDTNRKTHVKFWKKLIGDLSVEKVTSKEDFHIFARRILNAKKQFKTAANFNRYHSTLSVCLREAETGMMGEEARKAVVCNVMRFVKREKARIKYREPFSVEEINKLLDECKKSKNEDLYFIVKLAFVTGKRKSEIMNLRAEMIFEKQNFVVIPAEETKTQQKDVLFSVDDKELWKFLLKRKKKIKKGKIFQFKNPRKALHNALLRADVDTKKKFQVARATVATTLLEAKQADAGTFLDHTNASTTAKYYLKSRLSRYREQQQIIIKEFNF